MRRRIALTQERQQDLCEQCRFTFREVLVHLDVTGLDAVAEEAGGGARDRHRLEVVDRAHAFALDGYDEAVRLELVQPVLVDAGSREQRRAVEERLVVVAGVVLVRDGGPERGKVVGPVRRGGVVEAVERQLEALAASFPTRCGGRRSGRGVVGDAFVLVGARRGAPSARAHGDRARRLVGRRRARPVLVESLLDDLQREEVLALLVQDPAQPLDVGLVEHAVPRRRAFGSDEPLTLEETDLRDRHVRELVLEKREHFTDREVLLAGRGRWVRGRVGHAGLAPPPPRTNVRT